jgi:membrane dipeptidase
VPHELDFGGYQRSGYLEISARSRARSYRLNGGHVMVSDTDTFLVDALQVSNFFGTAQPDYMAYYPQRHLLQQWRDGQLDCVHVTCVLWENARQALDAVSRWNRAAQDFPELLCLARSAVDIRAAKSSGRTAVILGMQNTSPFEDDLSLVEVFYDLGIRIAQPTYNIQNFVGCSCYDLTDAGLTRFGQFVIGEMNRLGMAIDLSHVGDRTSLDVLAASSKPVAITHAMPRWGYDHPRNKTDQILKALAENGGIFGLSIYPSLMGTDVSLSGFCETAARLANQIGVDHVGIGTDLALGWTTNDAFSMSMGRWSHDMNYGAHSATEPGWPPMPSWFQDSSQFHQLLIGLTDHGFSMVDAAKVCGNNWIRFFEEVF